MTHISLRFYEELNDLLPRNWQKVEITYQLSRKTSIKDLIESLGVPHTEVDLILVNRASVDFSYIVQPGDRISVYPVFEAFDITSVTHLRPKPLRETRFVLDVHLGRLAVYLRFAGYDTLYRNDYHDEELAHISVHERRILLTRDKNLLKHSIITHGYYVRTTDSKQQLAEVFRRFHLSLSSPLAQRCTCCNSPIVPIAKEQIFSRLSPNTREYYDEFSYCSRCDKIYWKGSHYRNMLRSLTNTINEIM